MCGGSGIRFHEGGFSRWWLTSGALYPHGTSYNNLGTSSNRVGNLFIQTSVDLVDDDAELRIGDSDDLKLYHDGSNNWIKSVTGQLKLETVDSIQLFGNNSETLAQFSKDGACYLYFNNSQKDLIELLDHNFNQ